MSRSTGNLALVADDVSPEEMIQTILTIAGGLQELTQKLTATLQFKGVSLAFENGIPVRAFAELLPNRITKREQEVIQLISLGRSNAQIAMQLHVASHTVKSHVRNIMDKLNLHTRLEIAAYAHVIGRESPGGESGQL